MSKKPRLREGEGKEANKEDSCVSSQNSVLALPAYYIFV